MESSAKPSGRPAGSSAIRPASGSRAWPERNRSISLAYSSTEPSGRERAYRISEPFRGVRSFRRPCEPPCPPWPVTVLPPRFARRGFRGLRPALPTPRVLASVDGSLVLWACVHAILRIAFYCRGSHFGVASMSGLDRSGVSSRRKACSSPFYFGIRTPASHPDRMVESSTSVSTMTRKRSVSASFGTLRLRWAFSPTARPAQTPQPLTVPPDSPRWELEGEARPAEYQGRKCLSLDGGAATAEHFQLRDGVVDVDVATPASRGFFGIQFGSPATTPRVYLRQHQSAIGRHPVPARLDRPQLQIYNGPGFTAAVDIPKDVWFHLRLEVAGAQAKFFVKDMEKPALVMNDLKRNPGPGRPGGVEGATYFSNLEVRTTPDARWERRLPPMPPGTLAKWSISPSLDTLARISSVRLSSDEALNDPMAGRRSRAAGFVVLYRYREAPHPRITFQTDFSTVSTSAGNEGPVRADQYRLAPRSGQKLEIGYSDEINVFLNGKILWRGQSAQAFRDPRFLGIVNPRERHRLSPAQEGEKRAVLAVSELGGGWGFICRLADVTD